MNRKILSPIVSLADIGGDLQNPRTLRAEEDQGSRFWREDTWGRERDTPATAVFGPGTVIAGERLAFFPNPNSDAHIISAVAPSRECPLPDDQKLKQEDGGSGGASNFSVTTQ